LPIFESRQAGPFSILIFKSCMLYIGQMRFAIATLVLFSALIGVACPRPEPPKNAPNIDFDKLHQPLDILLKRYVRDGLVDYSAWKNNPADVQALENYLLSLADIYPDNIDSYGDRKAFWANAYNAWGIKLVLDRYPIKSVLFDENTNNDPRLKDFMGGPDRKIGTVVVSLDDIEERADTRTNPMLHFVLAKPAMGAPDMPNYAYNGKEFNNQIDSAVRKLLASERKGMRFDLPDSKVYLSEIFKQYRLEFGDDLAGFLKRYISPERQAILDSINKNQLNFDYIPFDWRLNDTKQQGAGTGGQGSGTRR